MKSLLVKVGGSTLGSHDTTLEDLASLQREGGVAVVVHGGGATISSWQDRLGLKAQFQGGLRVTDAPSLEVVCAVLAGLVNKSLVASLQGRGARAFGLSGADGGLLEARIKDESLGLVGEVVRVHPAPLQAVLDAGYLPVVAPLGLTKNGQLLNVNADTAAGELAAALSVGELLFLTDVPGVLGKDGKVIPSLSAREAKSLVRDGTIAKGMIPKVEACLWAAAAGVPARIVDGRRKHALLAVRGGEASGTGFVNE